MQDSYVNFTFLRQEARHKCLTYAVDVRHHFLGHSEQLAKCSIDAQKNLLFPPVKLPGCLCMDHCLWTVTLSTQFGTSKHCFSAN